MVLIAQWEPEPGRQPDREPGEQVPEEKPPVRYTVRFLSGGTALRSQSVTEGERVLEPERPKRKGYAFAGWYLGERKYSFEAGVKGNLDLTAKWKKVTVGKGNLLRVKNKKKGKAAVAIKKTAGAEGYQISYAQDRKFQKAGKRITTKKRSLTVRKLKKGKTYYFRVRAYKLDSWGRKVYGKYSGIRKLYMRK